MSEATKKKKPRTRRKARKKGKRKVAAKKAPTKKKTRRRAKKKSTTKKKATRKTGARRAPQGKRLGGWEIVTRDEVFDHLAKTKTTIATLARSLDVGASAVHAWKAGRRFPSEQAQIKLRDILQGKVTLAAKARKKPAAKAAKKGRKAKFNGKAFRDAREARGFSRAKLSKQMGVSPGAIRNWEVGASAPRGGNLAKAEAFMNEAPAASTSAPSSSSPVKGSGGTNAVDGAVQVASAYLSAGNKMSPDQVVAFVTSLRNALS